MRPRSNRPKFPRSLCEEIERMGSGEYIRWDEDDEPPEPNARRAEGRQRDLMEVARKKGSP